MKAVYAMRKETIERDFGTAFRKLSSDCKYKHYMCNMRRKSHEHHMTFMAFVYSLRAVQLEQFFFYAKRGGVGSMGKNG